MHVILRPTDNEKFAWFLGRNNPWKLPVTKYGQGWVRAEKIKAENCVNLLLY